MALEAPRVRAARALYSQHVLNCLDVEKVVLFSRHSQIHDRILQLRSLQLQKKMRRQACQ
jgi:hypothetical protein